MKYVGETDRTMREKDLKSTDQKKLNTPTGEHFNLKGHTISNLTFTIQEKVKVSDTLYRK